MVSSENSTAFSIGMLELAVTGTGTQEYVLVDNGDSKSFPIVISATLHNDNATYVDISWKDSNGTFYIVWRQSGAGIKDLESRLLIPPVEGCDLIARIYEAGSASNATGRISCDGVLTR